MTQIIQSNPMNMLITSHMKNRDWYLDQLGITQYILKKPAVMNGESAIDLTPNIRLIVVISSPPTEPVFLDILKAIQLDISHVLIITPEQTLMLPKSLDHVIWFIGCQPQPKEVINSDAIIATKALAELALSPQDKRQLWQQLCQYEHYFQTRSL